MSSSLLLTPALLEFILIYLFTPFTQRAALRDDFLSRNTALANIVSKYFIVFALVYVLSPYHLVADI